MCGFAGIWTGVGVDTAELEVRAERMAQVLQHRGPDSGGVWSDSEAGIAFGFRRLAIIDLSEHGHQPMRSASGRYTIVFNGEIYNHADLRKELGKAGFAFRGHSDTETLLAAIEHWGVSGATSRSIGMFAFAVWDAAHRTLSLVRDRLGIKPLFIYRDRHRVMFGSELKALLVDPEFDRTIDRRAVESYLRYLYVPAPASIFSRVRKLPPGHLITLRSPVEELPEPEPYWSMHDAARTGIASRFAGSDVEAVERLDQLLTDAVALRLVADVPVGALLSGGIDSTTIVALAQKAAPRPLRTYSVGFDVPEHDESAAAAKVAAFLGTEHTGFMLTGRDAFDLIPRLPEMFDEPLADPSQIPTYLVCQAARRDVVVALSGDGGDELFGGYHRYVHGSRIIPPMLRVPRILRTVAGSGLTSVSSSTWSRAYQGLTRLVPDVNRHRLVGEKVAKLGHLMKADSAEEMYQTLLSPWGAAALGQLRTRSESSFEAFGDGCEPDLLEQMMLTDQVAYLPDDLLAKVDRASMAVGLEVRVPLLDHRIAEFSWSLPPRLKIRDRQGKWALRQVLYRYVPRKLVDRPKTGFTVPIAAWLRGPLREWGGDLLHSDQDLLDPVLTQRCRLAWERFEAGDDLLANFLWAVFMLQAWQRSWLE